MDEISEEKSYKAGKPETLEPRKGCNLFDKSEAYLNNVLLCVDLELTSYLAERAIKPFVIGKKNQLFFDTDKGADASARCYSIIESASCNDLNVFGYLSYLLTELPKLGDNPTDEQLDDLMPWSKALPGYCKNV